MGIAVIKRLIDSVILIDHLNGIDAATHYVYGLNPQETSISVITRAEILVGINDEQKDMIKSLLNQYHLFVIDKTVADFSAELRKTHHWKLPDAFQAAICILNKIRLITRNTKDFNPEKHDFVEIPYLL